MKINILIGIGSGVASAIMFLALVSGNPIGLFVTLFLIPLPIAIAGLGWSRATALLATIVSAGTLALLTPTASLIYLIALGLPIVGFCYLLMLNRDLVGGDGKPLRQWFPIGTVLAAIAIWAGALSAFALLLSGGDIEGLRKGLAETIERFLAASGQMPDEVAAQITPERREQFVDLMLRLMPAATATMWVFIAVFNLWLAGRVVHQSGRLERPWPDLSTLVLPRTLNFVFMGAALLTFADGMVGLMAACMVWAIAFAFVLQGLAILHQITRGQGARWFILLGVYAALFLFQPISSMVVGMIGLAEPVSPLRRKITEAMTAGGPPPGAPPPPNTPPPNAPPPGRGPSSGPTT